MSPAKTPRLLVIAGTDSSGGAGLTRDTSTATDLGCQVAPVVTAVTEQTSGKLLGIHPIPTGRIIGQMRAALAEAPVQAIKIGMIGSAEAALAIAEHLPPQVPVVLDPVLKTSSGGSLGDRQSLAPLLSRVMLLTPNLMESASLSGRPVSEDPSELRQQARILTGEGPAAVLIKGGHASGTESQDHLFWPGGHILLRARRLERSARGTGCALATAISCFLAQGAPLSGASALGKDWLTNWLIRQQQHPN